MPSDTNNATFANIIVVLVFAALGFLFYLFSRPGVIKKLSKLEPDRYGTTNLLHYMNDKIGFYGREPEKRELEGFLAHKNPKSGYDISLWAITGAGGIGKSKLAYRFAKEQRKRNWKVIFLNHDRLTQLKDGTQCLDAAEFSPKSFAERVRIKQELNNNILLVADYANTLAEPLGEWLAQLAESEALKGNTFKLRVLLVARENYQPNQQAPAWYQALEKRGLSFYRLPFLTPGALDDKDLTGLLRDYAKGKGKLTDEAEKEIPAIIKKAKSLTAKEQTVRPLFCLIVMETYLTEHTYQHLSFDKVLKHIIERTQKFWLGTVGDEKLLTHFQEMMVCATVLGSCNVRNKLSDSSPFAVSSAALAELAVTDPQKMRSCLAAFNEGGESGYTLHAIEPDIVGEFYVLDSWQREYPTEEELVPLLQFFFEKSRYEIFCSFWVRCLSDYYGDVAFSAFFNRIFRILEAPEKYSINLLRCVKLCFALTFAGNRREDGVEKLRKFYEENPKSPKIALVYASGLFNLSNQQDADEAEKTVCKELKGIVEKYPQNPEIALKYAKGLYNLCCKYFRENRPKEGKEVAYKLKTVIQSLPDSEGKQLVSDYFKRYIEGLL